MPRPNRARSVGREDLVAQRVMALMRSHGMNYDSLASRMTAAGCAIQSSALFKIEKGEPRRRITVDELVAFAEVFEVTVEQLTAKPESVTHAEAEEASRRVSVALASRREAEERAAMAVHAADLAQRVRQEAGEEYEAAVRELAAIVDRLPPGTDWSIPEGRALTDEDREEAARVKAEQVAFIKKFNAEARAVQRARRKAPKP